MLRDKNALTNFLCLAAGLILITLANPANAQTSPERSRTAPAPESRAAVVAVTAAASDPAGAIALTGPPQTLPAKPQDAGAAEAGARAAAAGPAAADGVPVVTDGASAPVKAEGPASPTALQANFCDGKRTVTANVVAVSQPYMLNRLGAAMPQGMVFALERDVVKNSSGAFQLRTGKRPRPIVLRANVGDCLKINFTNRIEPSTFTVTTVPPTSPPPTPTTVPTTTQTSIHAQGMQVVNNISSDGSFVGKNPSALAAMGAQQIYTLFAEHEGTFLLYTMGDMSTAGQQLLQGLFGAVNVQPQSAKWYRSQVTESDLKQATYNAGRLPSNAKIKCPATDVIPAQCTLTVENGSVVTTVGVRKDTGGFLSTAGGQPIINYDAVYPDGATWPDGTRIHSNTPVLKMLDQNNELVYSDLTAIITGENGGRFVKHTPGPDQKCDDVTDPADAVFCINPALPDRRQPYREFTIIYHEVNNAAVQAFPIFSDPNLADTVKPGFDGFAINYGTGGIGAEIYANRIGVGPEANCVDCKYEEFFLSSWAVGDPAMVVDLPANSQTNPNNANADAPCTTNDLQLNVPVTCTPTPGTRTPASGFPYTMTPVAPKATKALYPDDPSNVYHSYLSDHVKFRIHHGGTGVTHAHHQHAHQWLQTPNSDKSAYLDTQLISPGASYTLEMVFGGSGNHNKTVGDSIFHCHFYPHFAAGMWSMWRVHDVFEAGTHMNADGTVAAGGRALPDGEIITGSPIPALVPLPAVAMAPTPSPVFIQNGQVVYGTPGSPDPNGASVAVNPGYPFFIPGKAGLRAPHPPMDFAPQLDAGGNPIPGKFHDGGLPRHLITGGSVGNEQHTKTDWSKDLDTLDATELPDAGTTVEKAAIAANAQRNHASFLPDGTPGMFVMNGLPKGPQRGAPFADPAIKPDGTPVEGTVRNYKAAAFQFNVVLNKKGWHFPQQRMLALWKDVLPVTNGTAGGDGPMPLFFRANSGEVIEIWHTNLIPNYYALDDFQVRTPTDIVGQHVHLVKFDVLASDGAANGWNYEDGTFAPPEVQEIIEAINKNGGLLQADGQRKHLTAAPPPSDIIPCHAGSTDSRCKPCPPTTPGHTGPVCLSWVGAQTTIQRWYSDPLKDNDGQDRSLRTVFTHDHFGPSTHQQAGLYAGALIEPKGSQWRNSETGVIMGGETVLPDGTTKMIKPPRMDGGPTSWKADILLSDSTQLGTKVSDSYREFTLEFQDFQLAYTKENVSVNPPSTPLLVSTGRAPGTYSVNYRHEPIIWRVGTLGDMSYAFSSSYGVDPTRPNGDPYTPLMRVYENDKVQIRTLVGAHALFHSFNIQGIKWLFEPSWPNSGYRSSQMMGLSEHFELLFHMPTTAISKSPRKCPDYMKSQGDCADYLYSPNYNDDGITNGMWGILRAYDPSKPMPNLKPLPNNTNPAPVTAADLTCPAGAQPVKFNITATTAQKALAVVSPAPDAPGKGQLVFNSRGLGRGTPPIQNGDLTILRNRTAIMYFHTEDLKADGTLRDNVPIEPLILRAAAGDCIEVTLKNDIDPHSDVFSQKFNWPPPFASAGLGNLKQTASRRVGLHPQLLSYDVTRNNGINVGYNNNNPNDRSDQSAGPGQTRTYRWYAGNIDRNADGTLTFTPVELGSLGLFPSDPMFQHINGMYGGMIVEPKGSTWQCDGGANCDPTPGSTGETPPVSRASATVTKADGTKFREFAVMFGDDLRISLSNSSAVNYRTDPTAFYRYGDGPNTPNGSRFAANDDNACALSNQLVLADPQTPIFTAGAGMPVRFRMMHPPGVGNEVFAISGHAWQRQPYTNKSTEIGNNLLSQWMGSRDNHASTDHADIVIDSAGGRAAVGGDYLYAAFLPSQSSLGLWGIFRVATGGGDVVSITSVVSHSPTVVQGVNSVNPNTGRFAQSVKLFNGRVAGGAPACSAPVDPFKGTWCFNCAANPCSVLTPASIFTVASSDGGAVTYDPAAQATACKPNNVAPIMPRTPPKVDDTQRFKPQPANKADKP
jgi:hypothetical protein